MTRIVYHNKGFRAVRRSAHDLVEQVSNKVCDAANADPNLTDIPLEAPHYEVSMGTNQDRARGYIRTANPRGMKHEAKTGALIKALNGG